MSFYILSTEELNRRQKTMTKCRGCGVLYYPHLDSKECIACGKEESQVVSSLYHYDSYHNTYYKTSPTYQEKGYCVVQNCYNHSEPDSLRCKEHRYEKGINYMEKLPKW